MTSGAITGADGRFRLDVEPGEYKLSARAQGFTGDPVTVTVGESGTSDVRLALTRGTSIRGRVVDARGQGVAGLPVMAAQADGDGSRFGGMAMTLGDGTFEIGGLGSGSYTLSSQSELGLFALRPGVAAGSDDVTLTLRRGGRALVTVLGPDGAPVRGAFASVRRVSGIVTGGMGGMPTDARGNTELTAPVGAVEIRAGKDELEGAVTVNVSEGATVAAEIRLAPHKQGPASR
jgi:hypothetical protein